MENKKPEILIIADYRGFFALSFPRPGWSTSIQTERLKILFEQHGYVATLTTFSQIDWSKDYSGVFVLYASSEGTGLIYKDYIEDILLTLKLRGAVLLPDLIYFRSHHNKVFMELLRQYIGDDSMKTISSRGYCSIRELKDDLPNITFPAVFKLSAGAKSANVALAQTPEQLIKYAKRYTGVYYRSTHWKWFRTSSIVKKIKVLVRVWRNTSDIKAEEVCEKFLVQNYIHSLNGDYKILVFGKRYYVLSRENRKHDFRASGSGKFKFPKDASQISGILDYASRVATVIDAPLHSLDIAANGTIYHLLEFQCIYFGPYTLQSSSGWFERSDGRWVYIEGTSNLEDVYYQAVDEYIKKRGR